MKIKLKFYCSLNKSGAIHLVPLYNVSSELIQRLGNAKTVGWFSAKIKVQK